MTGRPSLHLIELTAQQAEVLKRYARGMQQHAIATDMQISVTTVRSHTRDIFVRLGADNNAHAVALAIGLGILPVDVATNT